MAEFCRKCFIETFYPNAYEREHIVMSEDNDFCEGCMDHVPYVDYIDLSDSQPISTVEDFVRVVVPEVEAGHKIACVECGAVFEDDDLAFTHETGCCQYCYKEIKALWIKQ
jgi:hypothetical protein